MTTQLESDKDIYYAMERNDNYLTIANAQMYFKKPSEFPEEELELLQKVKGKTVELAAGAGRISLYLKEQFPNLSLLTTDGVSGAIEVCKKRGLENCQILDMLDFKLWKTQFQEPVDTFIVFGNSLGVIDNKPDLIKFFNELYELTSGDGTVLGDFRDPLKTENPAHLKVHKKNREVGNPPGLVKLRIRINEHVGDWFNLWLFSKQEFQEVIGQTNWGVNITGELMCYFELYK